MKITGLVVSFGVAWMGCGPGITDFSGTYFGNVTVTGSCTDGSQLSGSSPATWIVTQAGNVVTLSPVGGNCGDFTADAMGTVASIREKTCTPTATQTITAGPGSATLTGASLQINLPEKLVTTGAKATTCAATTAGALTRQAVGGSGGGGGGSSTVPAATSKRVFVTNQKFDGNLALAGGKSTGVAGADSLCSTAATAAGLSGTWKAWLSDANTKAIDRITGDGPWKKLDAAGTVVFNNKANLMTLPLVPIEYNENGVNLSPTSIDNAVWTGSPWGGSSDSCANWTSNSPTLFGVLGNFVDETYWTAAGYGKCLEQHRLYCFEQ